MLIEGPFEIVISRTAEKLDVKSLTADERGCLTAGLKYDPKVHSLYRFFVMAREREPNKYWTKRDTKRKSFDAVSRIYMRVDCEGHGVSLAGCYPSTVNAAGETEFDFEAYAEADILTVGKAGLKLNGPIKNSIRKSEPLVVAQRTDRCVDWIFARGWFRVGNELKAEINCIVEDAVQERALTCDVYFKDRGRTVERANRKVELPA